MAQVQYQAVGRRKKAIARVRLVPGDGKVVINGRDIDNYFGLETLKMTVRQPLALTNLEGRYDACWSTCMAVAFPARPVRSVTALPARS